MDFDTYRPRGGWRAHYRRKAIFDRVVSTLMAVAAFAVYATMVTIAESI